MAGQTLSTADAVLKEDYLPGVREQLNNDIFLAVVEKNSEDITGRRGVLALHLARNSGVGARAESGALPTAGNQTYFDEYVNLRYNYARIQVTGQTIKAMASDKTSFVRAVRSEMDGAVNDLKRDLNRQVFGTSDGKIATCGVTSATTVVQLAATTSQVQMRQFEVNMVVDIVTFSGGVATAISAGSAVTISAIDTSALTITISGAGVTTTSADFVVRSGAGGSGSSQQELTGLQTIVDNSGTLFNINPTTYPVWKAYKDSNSGTNRSISEMTFAKAQQQAHIQGGTDLDMWVTSDGVHRAYASLLTSLKRFPTTVDLKGGYKGLTADAGGVNQAAVTWDRDCPANTAFGLRTKNLIEFRMSDWEWMNEDGAVLQRVIGYDAYEATLFKYMELATDKRNAHAIIKDITEA